MTFNIFTFPILTDADYYRIKRIFTEFIYV